MGRNSTGAYTLNDCLQLRIGSFAELVKQGMNNFKGYITWPAGESVGFRLNQCYEQHVLEH